MKSLAGQNLVHVDSHDRQVGSLIKGAGLADDGGAVPDAAVLVVKGRAGHAPRVTRYRGELDDRAGLARFFDELKSGLLQFSTFRWPASPTSTDAADGAEEPTPRQRRGGQQPPGGGEPSGGGGGGRDGRDGEKPLNRGNS